MSIQLSVEQELKSSGILKAWIVAEVLHCNQ